MADFPQNDFEAGEAPYGADEQAMIPNPELMRKERVAKLGMELAKRRQDWVKARRASGIERRWREGWDQYNGIDGANSASSSMMDSVAQGGFPASGRKDTKPQRSKVFVNVTRPKTNAAVARLQEMLFPTDDRNWGLQLQALDDPSVIVDIPVNHSAPTANATPPIAGAQPGTNPAQSGTPAPQNGLVQGAQQAGVMPPSDPPMTPEEQKTALIRLQMEKALKAMEAEMDVQLDDAKYNAIGREVIRYAGIMGTGIVKGPIVVNRTRKMWKPVGDVHVLEIVEEKSPSVEVIDPRRVFPDPACGDNIHDGSGIFEYQDFTPKRVRELAKQPSYDKEAIMKVLEEGPQIDYDVEQIEEKGTDKETQHIESRSHFKVWSYWGDFEPEDLRAAGVDIKDGTLEVVSGCVIMINDTVIKAYENPLETGDFPYDFFNWEKIDGSPWGYGVPHLMSTQQRVLNAGWRQTMDNASLSVGPQIIMRRNSIQPADGVWEITGRKIWLCTDETDNVQNSFQIVDIPMHIDELQAIGKMAMEFIDLESSVPQITQGEQGAAPDTVGGLTILMNNSNVIVRRIVKSFDDDITVPLLSRWYDWNMAYNPKKDIKGDFVVDARGSTALLVRDMQNQALVQLGQYAANPTISVMINWDEWFKEVLKANHIDASRILKTDEEIKEAMQRMAQNPPVPPQVQVAQINAQAKMQAIQAEHAMDQQKVQGGTHPSTQTAQINAQARLEEANVRANAAQAVAQAKVQGELAYAEKMREIEMQNAQARAKEREDQMQLEIIKYANQQKVTLESIRADLAKTAMVEQTKRQMMAVGNQIKLNEHDKQLNHEATQNALDRQHDMEKHVISNLPSAEDQGQETDANSTATTGEE